MADPHKLSYEYFCMKPDYVTPKNILNLFEGFYSQSIKPIENEKKIDKLIKPIVFHLKEVIFQEHIEWGLDWLANMVQNPLKKSMVAIFIHGKEGDGKDIIFDFFRSKIIGDKYAFQTSSSEEIMGKFQSGSVNRVFVQWDEVDGSDIIGKNRTGSMKILITGPFVRYEIKGVMAVDTDNILNLLLTNSLNPIYISPADRRYCAFNSKSTYKGNAEYFGKLIKILDKPEVARAFYEHLMKRDITKYDNWQIGRPVTSYYKDLVTRNLHPIFSFLTERCVYDGKDFLRDLTDEKKCSCVINASQLFTDFNNFKMNRNIKSDMTATSFGFMIKKEFEECKGIVKSRDSKYVVYKMDYQELTEFMKSKNLFDVDV